MLPLTILEDKQSIKLDIQEPALNKVGFFCIIKSISSSFLLRYFAFSQQLAYNSLSSYRMPLPSSRLQRLVLKLLPFAILTLGVLLRLKILIQNRSLFIDEASLACNLCKRGYADFLLLFLMSNMHLHSSCWRPK